ncbi:hypothetical protein HMPREF1582_00522 [Gardnerella vaginalis JCP8151A]|nr:hypothetical protein HMPREF1582_00522 [Gardnerella vaginalis JCP8151A]
MCRRSFLGRCGGPCFYSLYSFIYSFEMCKLKRIKTKHNTTPMYSARLFQCNMLY